jgi:hypothetical protein
MWAHKPWIGTHLPAGTRPEATLAAYAALLDAVEGNTTFYAVPDERTVARWSEQALDELRTKPDLPVRPMATGPSPVVGFIGQTAAGANPPFWPPWVARCAA